MTRRGLLKLGVALAALPAALRLNTVAAALPRDPNIIAYAGEVVTCESGHEICDVAEDIRSDGRVSPRQFTNFRWDYTPRSATRVTRCPWCNAAFLEVGGFGAGSVVHIGDHWRGTSGVLTKYRQHRGFEQLSKVA